MQVTGDESVGDQTIRNFYILIWGGHVKGQLIAFQSISPYNTMTVDSSKAINNCEFITF